MHSYEWCQVGLNFFTLIVISATACIYYRQLRAMDNQVRLTQKQVERLEHSSAWEQKHTVLTSLDDIRDEVEQVLALDGKPFDSWTPEDRAAGRKVCYRLHIIGSLLVGQDSVIRLFGWTWFYALPNCHRILKPLIDEFRLARDPRRERYFSAFDYVAEHAKDAIKDYDGFTAPGAEQRLSGCRPTAELERST